MKPYEYNQVPKLPRRVVDMANADIIGYHKTRSAFDSVFVLAVLRAQDRIHLELLKMQHPEKTLSDKWWKFGFVAKSKTEFNDQLDAERMLVERHRLKAAGKYDEADAIRKRLESWGYEIGDEPNGTNWLVIR